MSTQRTVPAATPVRRPGRNSRPRLARGARLGSDRKTGEPVLLFPEGLARLNPTSHAILLRCDGQHTIDEIIAGLAREYPEEGGIADDVLECLEELAKHNVIENEL